MLLQLGKVAPQHHLHLSGCVTPLSVVAGRTEDASRCDRVYGINDSWTSGYRPHITQVSKSMTCG